MSTLTSLVKSGKRKILKKGVGQLAAGREGERESIKAQQKPQENTGAQASPKA
ncbi:MAG TPA: hypothetical protein VFQ30_12395 [Ktedonobacteraceae bacterium]|nr:hypothetical protein [Ktedonobacteraceae bacterium]